MHYKFTVADLYFKQRGIKILFSATFVLTFFCNKQRSKINVRRPCMRHIVTDAARSVCVCLLVTIVSPTKKAEPIEMRFGVYTWVVSLKHLLAEGPDSLREGAIWGTSPGPL